MLYLRTCFAFFTFLMFCVGQNLSKLGVPIKTTISATVLEEALHGSVTVSQLKLGQPLTKKVDHFLLCSLFFVMFWMS